MKKIITVLTFVLSLMGTLGGHVYAQEGKPPRQADTSGQGGTGRANPIFVLLDSNGDGVVSADEIANASVALARLDQNGDGKLTEGEVRPQSAGVLPPSPEEIVQNLLAFDRNKDGKLSKKEVPERLQGLFERGDANKDQVLSTEELRVMAEIQGKTPAGSPPPVAGRPATPPMMFMKSNPILAAIDADKNGEISVSELADSSESLKTLDKDGDGALSQNETRIVMPRRNMDEAASHLIEENDKNADGKLSREETPERLQALFDRADADKDGFLSKEELKKALESLQDGRPREGGPRPPSNR